MISYQKENYQIENYVKQAITVIQLQLEIYKIISEKWGIIENREQHKELLIKKLHVQKVLLERLEELHLLVIVNHVGLDTIDIKLQLLLNHVCLDICVLKEIHSHLFNEREGFIALLKLKY